MVRKNENCRRCCPSALPLSVKSSLSSLFGSPRHSAIGMRVCRRAAVPVLVLILLASAWETRAQEPLYYRGKEYGSESQYNPLSLILNGSFDIIQLDGHSRRV